ncbi:MAG: RdgB/HAM1 family non-canonical purine NTP pyrophosphatase [Pseudomonadota bacterium]|nr:non-canonical purine NTP pyrophosphatase, RdgB/HAM1 family [Gammaproteobacteria bacterium]MEE2684209.1 RdgB/HAM1 family non-canonical purine NTP pyrophosphatase [Pseudomonadota bacterium]|tara:strand:- start:2254 stop:2862 length:609 start_codon:yes stop_codon:yes gene_type:complete
MKIDRYQWVLASDNNGKIEEILQVLKGLNIEIIPQTKFGISTPEETESTFIENALLKAKFASSQTGLPSIADDSGLSVEFLNGEPGIYSSRYAGQRKSDEANINKLLNKLKGVPETKRLASFHAVTVAMRTKDDPAPIICYGKWDGIIADKAHLKNGFGYDPIFFDPNLNKMASELSLEEKNRVSHRAQALKHLKKYFSYQK